MKKEFDRKAFLESKLGVLMQSTVCVMDLTHDEKCFTRKYDIDWVKAYTESRAEWHIFKVFLYQYSGIEYNFVRTRKYYGIYAVDEDDWLVKVYRK